MHIDDVELEQVGKAVLIRVPDPDHGVVVGIRVNPAGNHPDVIGPTVVTWINKLSAPLDIVGVMFKEFDSPADAALAGSSAVGAWSYADPGLKLTIGDKVIVPWGHDNSERMGTVVTLNAPLPPAKFKLKRVVGRTWPL